MNSPIERVRRCLVAHGASGRVVVAVSGGADSVCLLHILGQIRGELGLDLHAAHLNHGLQPQAEAHAHYVARLCRRLGVPLVVGARDVGGYRTERRLSLEEAARQVRYAFLSEVAQECGARWVVTGHTADDQVETVLMHLLRGAGLGGLQGMAEAGPFPYALGSPLRLLRPLLSTTKGETEAYCRSHHLRPRQDPTNLDLSLLRNRVRHELLPLLAQYNAGVSGSLLRLSEVVREQVALLDSLVEHIWPDAVVEDVGGVHISSPVLQRQHRAVRLHLLRRAVEHVVGSFTDFEAHHLERLEQALSLGAGRTVPLPHGLRAVSQHRGLYLARRQRVPLPPLEGEYPLVVPGETVFPGWRVRATLLERADVRLCPGPWRIQMAYEPGVPLWVRRRRPGDRFHPLGLSGSKKLQDFMVDAHIPRELRDNVPLVCSPQGIIWVAGWRLAEAARVLGQTKLVLEVLFEGTGSQ